MREARKIELDTSKGKATFTVQHLHVKTAIRLSAWIMKRAGALAKAVPSGASGTEMLIHAMSALDDDDFEHLAKTLVQEMSCVVDGKNVTVDYDTFCQLFRGELLNAFKLLTFTLSLNFENFGPAVVQEILGAWTAARPLS